MSNVMVAIIIKSVTHTDLEVGELVVVETLGSNLLWCIEWDRISWALLDDDIEIIGEL